MTQNSSSDKSTTEAPPTGISAESYFRLKSELSTGHNLADAVRTLSHEFNDLKTNLPALIQSLLVDTYQYRFLSFNLLDNGPDLESLGSKLNNLNLFDVVLAFYVSTTEIVLINPANPIHLDTSETSLARRLVVAYAKSKSEQPNNSVSQFLLELKSVLLENLPREVSKSPTVKKSDVEQTNKTERRQKFRMTLQYGVSVTNGTFHYGNVEAWSNIIESYEAAYPHARVLLFYRSQRIYRIYSLFGWGKIRFGDHIFFAVAGRRFKDVAKLKKYLVEGASPRFQPFIKKNVNLKLKLF